MSIEMEMRGENGKDINMMEEVNGKYKEKTDRKIRRDREREIKDREQEGAK